MPLRLPWTQTWPDTPNDGCVQKKHLASSMDVLRVMLRDGGPNEGLWYWTASKLVDCEDGMQQARNTNGYSETRLGAQEAAEAAYFGWE